MSATLIKKRDRKAAGGNHMRISQGTDMANLIESQNSIFDQMERLNSLSKSSMQNPGGFSGMALTNILSSNQIQQATSSGGNLKQQQKRRTFKEVIDSLDQQENEVYKLNRLLAGGDGVQDKNSKDGGASVSLQNGVVEYEQFQVNFENRVSSQKVANQNLDQHAMQPRRAHLPTQLYVESQTTEGALARGSLAHMQLRASQPQSDDPQSPILVSKDNKHVTPHGIAKRVMPDKKDKPEMVTSVRGLTKSFDPTTLGIGSQGYLNQNMALGLRSERDPLVVGGYGGVPQLTDRLNTNLKNFETSQNSVNQKSTFRQEDEPEEDVPNCYLLLPWDDITLIIDSINEDEEQMKIYFGCKALKSILFVAPPLLTRQVLDRFSNRLLKRLVVVLSYEHLPDAMHEALYIVVLLTNLMDYETTSEMVMAGLIAQLNKFVDVKFMQARSSKKAAELALQIVANVTKISNLAVVHLQKVYFPEIKKDDEATTPGLTFIDRMTTLSRLSDTDKTEVAPQSPILEADQNAEGTSKKRLNLSPETSCFSLQEQWVDIRVQISQIAENAIARKTELEDENMAKIVTLLLELLVQTSVPQQSLKDSSSQQQSASPTLEKSEIIWKVVIGTLCILCGKSETVCSVLEHHPQKALFAKSLIDVAVYCHRQSTKKQLLMDTLVLIGDLTASESFSERVFFVEYDFFTQLRAILNSPALDDQEVGGEKDKGDNADVIKEEPSKEQLDTHEDNTKSETKLEANKKTEENTKTKDAALTKTKFLETIVWTASNALADDADCQSVFFDRHSELLDDFFKLVPVDSDKIKLEICFLIDNILRSNDTKEFIFAVKDDKAAPPDVNSSFKESDGEDTQLPQPKASATAAAARNSATPRSERYVSFVKTITAILSQRQLALTDRDDTIEYQALRNLQCLFRFDKRRLKTFVLGDQSDDQIGYAPIIEQIYRMEHHWSQRVYERALLLSRRYLHQQSSSTRQRLHKTTDLFSELCQETLFKPDQSHAQDLAKEYTLSVKRRGRSPARRGLMDESDGEDGSSADDEGRDRSKTFMMSVGEKRAYEVKMKIKREYNARVKILFVNVVSSYIVCQAPMMRIIDMTNDGAVKKVEEPKDKVFQMINCDEEEEEQKSDEAQSRLNQIPKIFLTYAKFTEIRHQKALQVLRERQAHELKLKLAQEQEERQALEQAMKNSVMRNKATDRASSKGDESSRERRINSRKSSLRPSITERRKSSIMSGSSMRSKDSKKPLKGSKAGSKHSKVTTTESNVDESKKGSGRTSLAANVVSSSQPSSSNGQNTGESKTKKKKRVTTRVTIV